MNIERPRNNPLIRPLIDWERRTVESTPPLMQTKAKKRTIFLNDGR